jgi:hypothetical protein
MIIYLSIDQIGVKTNLGVPYNTEYEKRFVKWV